jgi:hypothetical protein
MSHAVHSEPKGSKGAAGRGAAATPLSTWPCCTKDWAACSDAEEGSAAEAPWCWRQKARASAWVRAWLGCSTSSVLPSQAERALSEGSAACASNRVRLVKMGGHAIQLSVVPRHRAPGDAAWSLPIFPTFGLHCQYHSCSRTHALPDGQHTPGSAASGPAGELDLPPQAAHSSTCARWRGAQAPEA